MINSCMLCGLCEELCPGNFSMAAVCLDARRVMVGQNRMPPSAHEFALRDMAFANGDHCALARHAPGKDSSRHLFFPGCQLTACDPGGVAAAYDDLRARLGKVGLLLSCCGAPARTMRLCGRMCGPCLGHAASRWSNRRFRERPPSAAVTAGSWRRPTQNSGFGWPSTGLRPPPRISSPTAPCVGTCWPRSASGPYPQGRSPAYSHRDRKLAFAYAQDMVAASNPLHLGRIRPQSFETTWAPASGGKAFLLGALC